MRTKPNTKKIVIDVPVYDQWKDAENDEWTYRSCSICALKTILVFKDKENGDLTIMSLIKEGLGLDGYAQGIGWKHQGLVDIARKHGVELKFQKHFFAGDDKLKGLDFINKNILKGHPVMASIMNRSKDGGHMIVVHGFEDKGSDDIGYFILDPDSRGRNRYSLSRSEFLSVWRGGLIWLS